VDCFYAYFVEKYFLVKVLDFCSNWFVTTKVIEHLSKKKITLNRENFLTHKQTREA
jgi:hypothetical protein